MRSLSTRPSRAALLEALPVAAIVLVATIAASLFALQLSQYVVMPDELGYVKQAVVLSHGELPTPGSFWFNSWALLHSALLAPLYRFASTTTAFDAGHVLGALLVSSTAIPVYLIARRVLAWRPGALLAAALSVATPWLAMAGTMMTEVVAYPAFAWACLAMLNGISRPGLRGDLLVALAFAVAFVSRTQLLILAPAYVFALVLDVLLRRELSLRERTGEALRAHAPMIAVVIVGILGVIAAGSISRVLGNYETPTQGGLFPAGTGAATRELLAYVVVAVGGIPLALAAAWALTTVHSRVPRDEHAFAVLLVAVVPILTIVGGSFTVRFTAGINDRYLFYVVPLLFIGALAAAVLPRPRLLSVLVATGAITVWLLATASLRQQGPTLISPSMSWHSWLTARASNAGMTPPHLVALGTALLLALLALAMRLLRWRAAAAAIGGLLLVWGIAQTAYTFDKVAATQEGVDPGFLSQRGWIDRALPKNARATTVLASLGDQSASTALWWDISFWNKSIDRMLTLNEGSAFGQGFHQTFSVDPQTGRVPALDRYQYVVRYANDTRFGLRGSRTVANAGAILVLTAARPYRADWLFEGPDPDAALVPPGNSGRVRAFAAGPGKAGRVAVTLAATGTEPVPVTVASGRRRRRAEIPGGGRATLTVPARFEAGHADAEIKADPGKAGVALIDVVAS